MYNGTYSWDRVGNLMYNEHIHGVGWEPNIHWTYPWGRVGNLMYTGHPWGRVGNLMYTGYISEAGKAM